MWYQRKFAILVELATLFQEGNSTYPGKYKSSLNKVRQHRTRVFRCHSVCSDFQVFILFGCILYRVCLRSSNGHETDSVSYGIRSIFARAKKEKNSEKCWLLMSFSGSIFRSSQSTPFIPIGARIVKFIVFKS